MWSPIYQRKRYPCDPHKAIFFIKGSDHNVEGSDTHVIPYMSKEAIPMWSPILCQRKWYLCELLFIIKGSDIRVVAYHNVEGSDTHVVPYSLSKEVIPMWSPILYQRKWYLCVPYMSKEAIPMRWSPILYQRKWNPCDPYSSSKEVISMWSPIIM